MHYSVTAIMERQIPGPELPQIPGPELPNSTSECYTRLYEPSRTLFIYSFI